MKTTFLIIAATIGVLAFLWNSQKNPFNKFNTLGPEVCTFFTLKVLIVPLSTFNC